MTVLTKLTKAELVALLKDAQDKAERTQTSYTALSNVIITQITLLQEGAVHAVAVAKMIEGMKEQIRKYREIVDQRGLTIHDLQKNLEYSKADFSAKLHELARQGAEDQKTIVELERQLASRICEMCAIHLGKQQNQLTAEESTPAEEQFEGCPYARCECVLWHNDPNPSCLMMMSDAAQLRWRKKIQD